MGNIASSMLLFEAEEYFVHGEDEAGMADLMLAAALSTSPEPSYDPPTVYSPPLPRRSDEEQKAYLTQFDPDHFKKMKKEFERAKRSVGAGKEMLNRAISELQSEMERLLVNCSITSEAAEIAGKSTCSFIQSMKNAKSSEDQDRAIKQYRESLNPFMKNEGGVALSSLIGAIIVAAVASFGFAAPPLLAIAYGVTGGAAAGGLFSCTTTAKIKNGEKVIIQARESYRL
jgi:hypothetical protein